MAGKLYLGLGDPGPSPDLRVTALCSCAKQFALVVHKWVPFNLILGVTLQWTSMSSMPGVGGGGGGGGGVEIILVA